MNGKNQIDRILIYFIFVVCVSCSSGSDTKDFKRVEIEYNQDSTSVISVGYIDKYGRQGEWYFFDDAGYMSKIANYHQGELNGKVIEYKCCRKFMEYTALNGEVKDKITFFSPDGEIANITIVDTLGRGFDLSLFNGQIYELNIMFNKDSLVQCFSNMAIDASGLYPTSYGCCKGD